MICSYVIPLEEEIKLGVTTHEVFERLFLVRASVMYAIVLYARWFGSTKSKTMLEPECYFESNTQEMAVHEKLVTLRNKYIVHNELDLLGSDRVWVNTDDTGRFESSDSDFLEEMRLQGDELNMSTFQRCAQIVHDKIDSEIVPDLQNKLDKRLRKITVSSTCKDN